MNRAVLLVAIERSARRSAREIAGGFSLPRLALATDAEELYPLGDSLDWLQLFGIAAWRRPRILVVATYLIPHHP